MDHPTRGGRGVPKRSWYDHWLGTMRVGRVAVNRQETVGPGRPEGSAGRDPGPAAWRPLPYTESRFSFREKRNRQKFFMETQKRCCAVWCEAPITRSTDGAALHEAARRRRKRKRKQAVGSAVPVWIAVRSFRFRTEILGLLRPALLKDGGWGSGRCGASSAAGCLTSLYRVVRRDAQAAVFVTVDREVPVPLGSAHLRTSVRIRS